MLMTRPRNFIVKYPVQCIAGIAIGYILFEVIGTIIYLKVR